MPMDTDPDRLDTLPRRLARLEDRARIQDLIAAYAIAVDDRDLDAVVSMFTEDGEFVRSGVTSRGRDAIRAFYRDAMDRYILTLHQPLSDLLSLDGDHARGLLTGRAELALDGTLVLASYRYADEYVRRGEDWFFARRDLRFHYAVPVEELNDGICSPERVRWPGTPPRQGDLPQDRRHDHQL